MEIETELEFLNDVEEKYLPRLTVDKLVIGQHYPARIMRKVNTRYSLVYVIESDNFRIFLPKKFSHIGVTEFVKNRYFTLDALVKLPNGKLKSRFSFFKKYDYLEMRNRHYFLK